MAQDDEDVLSELEPLLHAADLSQSPWDPKSGEYVPDYDLARKLLAVPIGQGYADDQESGRTAKALDAWIAHELRRAGFPYEAIWPRMSRPRILPADLVPVGRAIDNALARLDEFNERLQAFGEAAVAKGLNRSLPSLYRVWPAVRSVREALPGDHKASILGSHYVKQVDVVMSTWQRGAEILISGKTQFSSYQKNKNNRYEEALGEIKNLKDRHPMAATGYVFLVRTNVFQERGAFAFLRDLLIRTRKPDGPFDATMLLAAEWDDGTNELTDLQNSTSHLSAPRFFADIIDAVTSSTPFDLHQDVRTLRDGEPPGGLPGVDDAAAPHEAIDVDQFE
jgi:hypothetical protein